MICNVGDTLTMFSGGLLNSNIHRVVYVHYCYWLTPLFLLPIGLPLVPNQAMIAGRKCTSPDPETQLYFSHCSMKVPLSPRLSVTLAQRDKRALAQGLLPPSGLLEDRRIIVPKTTR